MKYIREHVLEPSRVWQSVGMHDGALPFPPFWRDDTLILPCLEEGDAPEVSETVWICEAEHWLDEAMEQKEVVFLGSVSWHERTVYVFVEVEEEEAPVRRVTHPALLDAEKSQDREPD